jgi:hypothetical protein
MPPAKMQDARREEEIGIPRYVHTFKNHVLKRRKGCVSEQGAQVAEQREQRNVLRNVSSRDAATSMSERECGGGCWRAAK